MSRSLTPLRREGGRSSGSKTRAITIASTGECRDGRRHCWIWAYEGARVAVWPQLVAIPVECRHAVEVGEFTCWRPLEGVECRVEVRCAHCAGTGKRWWDRDLELGDVQDLVLATQLAHRNVCRRR